MRPRNFAQREHILQRKGIMMFARWLREWARYKSGENSFLILREKKPPMSSVGWPRKRGDFIANLPGLRSPLCLMFTLPQDQIRSACCNAHPIHPRGNISPASANNPSPLPHINRKDVKNARYCVYFHARFNVAIKFFGHLIVWEQIWSTVYGGREWTMSRNPLSRGRCMAGFGQMVPIIWKRTNKNILEFGYLPRYFGQRVKDT